MNGLELTGTIAGSLVALLVGYKGIVEKYVDRYFQKKQEKATELSKKSLEKKNSNTLNNGVEIYKLVRWILKQYDCNRVMVLGLHNSGEILTGLCEKKISIFYEDTSAKTIKEIEGYWQSRIVDFEMLRFMDHVNKDEFLHYTDITMSSEDNQGIRELVNAKQGQEIYVVKIGWFSKDKLICLLLQRDFNNHRSELAMHHRAIINYKATEIKELLSDSNLRV